MWNSESSCKLSKNNGNTDYSNCDDGADNGDNNHDNDDVDEDDDDEDENTDVVLVDLWKKVEKRLKKTPDSKLLYFSLQK